MDEFEFFETEDCLLTNEVLISRQYLGKGSTLRKMSYLYGPNADSVAKQLKLPKGFKTDKGWILSGKQRKRCEKLGVKVE